MKVQDAIALVTGANRGIGRAIVEDLLARGAKRVYATARHVADLDPVLALDRARVRAVRLDVTDHESVEAAAGAAADVTLLVNNAGVAELGGLLDLPFDGARRNMEVNYFGVLAVTRAFAPVLEANGGGAVVNLLSVVSLASMPGIGGYNASKAAAWSLTQSLRSDLGKRGITVHGVFPGPVDTDMAKDFPLTKTPAIEVARAILSGVESQAEDIFPDPMAREVHAVWSSEPKALERQFSAM